MTGLFKRVVQRNVIQPASKLRKLKAVKKAESLVRYVGSSDFREEADKRIVSGLESLGLAKRSDVTALEKRLTDLELRLAAETAKPRKAAKPSVVETPSSEPASH